MQDNKTIHQLGMIDPNISCYLEKMYEAVFDF